MEAENSKLRKELIAAMNDANQAKEKLRTLTDELRVERELTKEKDEQIVATKERAKGLAAKAVEGFQQTEEYNSVLFSWSFKGFELLRRYFIKHPSWVDLEKLDLEEVDKEMAAEPLNPLLLRSTPQRMPLSLAVLQLTPEPAVKKNISILCFFFFFFWVPVF